MTALRVNWREIHRNRGFGAWPLGLGAFSFVYGAGVYLRHKAYEMGWLKGRVLPGFVLSVGNLTVGGTGKTPAVVMLAKWAKREGFRVAVLSRGYGGRLKNGVLEVSDGRQVKTSSQVSGDEPFLLASCLSGIPVLISRDRYEAGIVAHRRFGSDFFILDDGFQHLPLRRDLDLVLMDAEDPSGNGRLLPMGPLREPLRHLKRADVIIFTRAKEGGANNEAFELLETYCPKRPVFFEVHEPDEVVFPVLKQSHGPGILKGKRVAAFAGIAHPLSFMEMLTLLGADVAYFQRFPDHHVFSQQEAEALVQEALGRGSEYLLTTEKDWVRIRSLVPDRLPTGYLRIRFSLVAERERFFQMIRDAIKNKQRLQQGPLPSAL